MIGTDDVSLIGGTATFNNANAGLSKTVTITGVTLGGVAVGNYSLASVNTTTANITKANITFTVTGYAVKYDGAAHTATATATGVNGEDLSAGVNLSGTTHTTAGTYTDTVTCQNTTGNYFNATKLVKNFIV